jgi:hypothetical protein
MAEDIEGVVIASGDMDHVRGLQRQMATRGIEARLLQPPDGCGSS